MEEVLKRKEDLIKDLQGILKLKVCRRRNSAPNAPLGQGVKDALSIFIRFRRKRWVYS